MAYVSLRLLSDGVRTGLGSAFSFLRMCESREGPSGGLGITVDVEATRRVATLGTGGRTKERTTFWEFGKSEKLTNTAFVSSLLSNLSIVEL